jgi:hypothetical protein
MAVTLSTAARNAACDAIVDLVDDGEAEGTGALVIKDGSTVLVTMQVGSRSQGRRSPMATLTATTLSTATGPSFGPASLRCPVAAGT